jgi:hypothetical protein
MKINPHIVTTPCPSGNRRLRGSHCSGAFGDHIRRAALPAVMLAVAVVLATGCSSTGTGFHPLLISSPLPAAQQSSDLEENSLNQLSRSPAFNDLFWQLSELGKRPIKTP